MNTDVEQMLINEYQRIERAIARREAQLAALQKRAAISRQNQLNRRPKRYSVEFDFVPGNTQAQTRSFFVDGGTVFRAKSVESNFRVTGVGLFQTGPGATSPGQVVSVSVPYNVPSTNDTFNRSSIFDYFWQIRDTGSDREWQNEPQPSLFMDSGMLGPKQLPVHARVRGGAEVFVTIDPFLSDPSAAEALNSVSAFTLHISLFGTEVRE